MRIQSYTYSKQ